MSRLDTLSAQAAPPQDLRVRADAPAAFDFLTGGGEMGALMRTHDWAASPLGPPERWPQSLRTVAGLLLNSKFPMFLAWGPDLAFLYNDGYAPILGTKHPDALGRHFQDVWFEIWAAIAPLVERALAGEATFHENLPLTMLRKGYEEETWFTFSYSPVRDESGGIAGLFCACTETTGQVLAEEAVRASEERYRSFIAHSSEGIWRLELDPPLDTSLPIEEQIEFAYRDGRFAECNDVMARMYGLASADHVIGRTLDLMLPASDPEARAYLAEVIRAGYSVTDVESVERNAAGEAVYFSNSMVGVVEDGWLRHIWGIQRDISERREAEAALRESEDHYRHTVELNPQVPWTSGPDGQLDHVSRRWLDWTGTTGLGSTWGEAVHPDDLPPSIAAWTRSVTTGEPYDIEHRIRLRGGEYHWMHSRAYPRRDETGRIVKWYGTTEDIQESKAAAESLKQSEQRFRSLVEATTAVVWNTDSQGAIVSDSPSWAAFTGQTEPEYRGWGWLDAVQPDDRARTAETWRAALAARTPYECEYRLRRHDGAYRDTVARGVPLAGSDGQVREWIGANADITEQTRAEAHKTLLIHELNHRVKNTLATVQSIAAQTLRNAPSLEQARAAFESRLLALSRAHDVLTRENWEGAGLREIVEQALAPYANRREDRLHLSGRNVRLPPRMALALAMALQELATNAVKYGALSNETGAVEIAWNLDRKIDPPRLRLRWGETDGPPVSPPVRRGFGSRLIERSLALDLDGEVVLDFAPGGVVCAIDAPVA